MNMQSRKRRLCVYTNFGYSSGLTLSSEHLVNSSLCIFGNVDRQQFCYRLHRFSHFVSVKYPQLYIHPLPSASVTLATCVQY